MIFLSPCQSVTEKQTKGETDMLVLISEVFSVILNLTFAFCLLVERV